MILNIKNDEAHKLATELAELTGESLTFGRHVRLCGSALTRERRRRRTDRIAARLMTDRQPVCPRSPDTGRSPDEILGYDKDGLPT